MNKENATKALKYFNLSLNCSEKELKKNYFNKIKNLHPDVHLSKNKSIQKKYQNDFLEAYRQYHIAKSFLKEKRDEKNNPKYTEEHKPFNDLNKNNKQSFSFTISPLNYFFKNIKLTKILFYLKKRYFLLSIPLIIYYLKNNISTKNNKRDNNLSIKSKVQDSYILKNKVHKLGKDSASNEKKNEISLFKLRYIFNVVRINKDEKEETINYINRNIFETKKNDINNLKKKISVRNKKEDANISNYTTNLKNNKIFFDHLLKNKNISINLLDNPISILQRFSTFLKEISSNNTFAYDTINFSYFRKNIMKKKDNIKRVKNQSTFFKKSGDTNPLYKRFLLDAKRGIHNESRYINGIGGLCGGYDLIKAENEKLNKEDVIKKENSISKDLIYMNSIRNKELIDDLIKLQNSIIYEKAKYIDFSNPLKYKKYRRDNKININGYFKYRNCKIPLKETIFEKNIKKNIFNNPNNIIKDNLKLSLSLDEIKIDKIKES